MHNFFVETVTANVAPESQITASVDIEAADPPESMSQEASAVNSNTANASNTTDSDINEDNVSVTVNVDDQGSSPVQWITDSLVETELTDGLDIVTEPAQEALQMEPESSDGDVIMTVTNS